MADRLSIDHINLSLRNLESVERFDALTDKQVKVLDIDKDKFAQALLGLSLKVKTRKH